MSSSLGRVPQAMMAVTVLTFMPIAGADVGLAGLSSGCVGIGSALGAPVFGRLVDRHGPHRVLVAAALIQAVAFAALLFTAPPLVAATRVPGTRTLPIVLLLVHCALIGASCPQIGAVARVVWRKSFGTDARMTTAMSYESTVDELSFVVGPVLVGLLASTLHPAAPLIFSALLVTAAVVVLVRVIPDVAEPVHHNGPISLSFSSGIGVALCALGMVSMGTVFGGTLTALLPFASTHGIPGATGMLYGAMSLTSAVMALSMPLWGSRVPSVVRWVGAGVLLLAASVALPHAGTVPFMIGALLLLGMPVGPAMVTIFEAASTIAPTRILATVMTILGSGIVTGTALSSAWAGALAQAAASEPDGGSAAAFAVPCAGAAGVLLTGVALAILQRVRAGQPSSTLRSE